MGPKVAFDLESPRLYAEFGAERFTPLGDGKPLGAPGKEHNAFHGVVIEAGEKDLACSSYLADRIMGYRRRGYTVRTVAVDRASIVRLAGPRKVAA